MKQTITLIATALCLLFLTPASAQFESISETDNSQNEIKNINVNETENKQKLLERLDQVKQRLDESDHMYDCLEKTGKQLNKYRDEINNVQYGLIRRSFRLIAIAHLKKDNATILLEENRLRKRLQRFIRFYESNDTSLYVYAGINTRLDFYKLFESLLADLKTTEPFESFLNSPPGALFLTDPKTFDALIAVLSQDRITDLLNSFEEAVTKENDYIKLSKFKIERDVNRLKYTKRMIMDKLSQDVDIDFFSILLGLPLFCVTVLVLFMGPGFIQFKYGNGVANPLLEKSQSILLDLSTVLLLTMSVLILGLSGNINSDVLGTLIGGISGYVLNKAKP